MRTKLLFKIRLLSFAALCTMAFAVVSCANEDVAQNGKDTDNDKNYTEFIGGRPETRTTMDYNSGAFYWEAGDKIYVQDDNNVWQVSNNAPTSKVASFKFKVPGQFNDKPSYKVYYPGKNGTDNSVTIQPTQNQTKPNSTAHFGVSGDCGTADAKRVNGFHFALNHQAAILVFQPYNANSELEDCYLTKIEVTSDNNIAGSYTLDPTTGKLTGTGTGNDISVETTGSGAYTKGFPLTNNATNLATTGTYMLIQPGEHQLKVRYYLKDYSTNVEGTITKELSNFNYKINNYYDMSANLNLKDYDGKNYYMWDALHPYWYGYEWTKHLAKGVGQPTLEGQPAGNYAKSSTDSNNRWYNESSTSTTATHSCTVCPNANEMAWYIADGDPHWDEEGLWTTMGHLYKGGMWFLKHDKIPNYSKVQAPNGTDYRGTVQTQQNNSITIGQPSATEISKYFYLPALGCYEVGGVFGGGGNTGVYWSSNNSVLVSMGVPRAYAIVFTKAFVGLYNVQNRANGYIVQKFE